MSMLKYFFLLLVHLQLNNNLHDSPSKFVAILCFPHWKQIFFHWTINNKHSRFIWRALVLVLSYWVVTDIWNNLCILKSAGNQVNSVQTMSRWLMTNTVIGRDFYHSPSWTEPIRGQVSHLHVWNLDAGESSTLTWTCFCVAACASRKTGERTKYRLLR